MLLVPLIVSVFLGVGLQTSDSGLGDNGAGGEACEPFVAQYLHFGMAYAGVFVLVMLVSLVVWLRKIGGGYSMRWEVVITLLLWFVTGGVYIALKVSHMAMLSC